MLALIFPVYLPSCNSGSNKEPFISMLNDLYMHIPCKYIPVPSLVLSLSELYQIIYTCLHIPIFTRPAFITLLNSKELVRSAPAYMYVWPCSMIFASGPIHYKDEAAYYTEFYSVDIITEWASITKIN